MPKPAPKLRERIAIRELVRSHVGTKVTIELYKPHRRSTGEFECPYRIRGLGRPKVGCAFGEDSIQALQLSFEAVRLELAPYAHGLEWFGALGETGFPQFVPYSLGAAFTRRVNGIVEREVEREVHRLKAGGTRDRKRARRKRNEGSV
ncbi:MAG TPA: hypothetical protein VFS23_21580 [Vicinamibacterales bacterium]|nr:hypothetical protein [Vicinamibacterales bacterium]